MAYTLSVIIPCYNEAARLPATLAGIRDFVARSEVFDDGDIEWIFVDDGSTDGTATLLAEAARAPHVTVVSQPENRGKGAAVQAGDRAASAELRAFTDCDLATPLAALEDVRRLFAEAGPDLVIGSRHAPTSRIAQHQPWPRFVVGRLFSLAMAHFHRSAFTDTQCGFKAWHANVSRAVVQRLVDPGWSFDLDMIGRAEARGAVILELPVTWTDRAGSKVNALAVGPRMVAKGLRYGLRDMSIPLVLLGLLGLGLAINAAANWSNDFGIYYEAWRNTRAFRLADLYTPERTTQGGFYYSPFFAVLGLPLAFLSKGAAAAVYAVVELGVLTVSLILLKRWVRYYLGGITLSVALWATFILLFLNNVSGQFQAGNVSLHLYFLCFLSGYAFLFRHPRLSAFWLGLAINIKIFPIFLLGFAILRRDWRYLATVGLVVAALVLVPTLYFGWDPNWHLHREWWQTLSEYGAENDYGRDTFQSLPSALYRLATHLGTSPETALRLGQLAVVGAATGVWWTFRRRLRAEWMIVYSFFLAFTAQFVPSSWVDMMGFFYAPLVLLTMHGWARRRRWPYSAALVVFLVSYGLTAPDLVTRPVNDFVEQWSIPTIGIWVFLIAAFLFWRKASLPHVLAAALRTDREHLAPGPWRS